MEARELLTLVKSLDPQNRIRLYLTLAQQLTIRGREAYSYDAERARGTYKGFNELLHSLLGHVQALESDAPRCTDEEFSERLFGFAERLGVQAHLRLALDAVASMITTHGNHP